MFVVRSVSTWPHPLRRDLSSITLVLHSKCLLCSALILLLDFTLFFFVALPVLLTSEYTIMDGLLNKSSATGPGPPYHLNNVQVNIHQARLHRAGSLTHTEIELKKLNVEWRKVADTRDEFNSKQKQIVEVCAEIEKQRQEVERSGCARCESQMSSVER